MIKTSSAIAALLLLCIGCNQSSDSSQSVSLKKEDFSPAGNINSDTGFQTADSTGQPQVGKEQKAEQQAPEKHVDWDKKIIKTANLDAEVKDYKAFSKSLSEKVKRYGGYISTEEQTQSDYEIENNIVIKVPVAEFENAVNDLLADVAKVNEKKITSDDVTTELVDGKSRLEAKKQVRLRYLDLLKQAKNMEEILNVQKEINDIQEEIETVAGRINYLGNSSAMSTIQLNFSQILDPSAVQTKPEDAGFATQVKFAFLNGWHWIREIFIGMLSIWPFLLLISGCYIFFRRRLIPKTK
jgi:hypothetical protein